jgi:hypothetical protein
MALDIPSLVKDIPLQALFDLVSTFLYFCEPYILIYLCDNRGPGSSVGTATGYGLDGPGIECSLRRGAVVFGPIHLEANYLFVRVEAVRDGVSGPCSDVLTIGGA